MESEYSKQRIPKYFTLAEMVKTGSGLPNFPDTWQKMENLRATAFTLDEIRGEFGKAIKVNSGYRSEAVNKAVGGSGTSAHMDGRAADIRAYSGKESDNKRLLAILEEALPRLDQLIVYRDSAGKIRFMHVGLAEEGTKPRGQRLER